MDEPERVTAALMHPLQLVGRVACGLLIAAGLVTPATAQPVPRWFDTTNPPTQVTGEITPPSGQSSPDWVKVTPPPGMRWKSRDQSTVTSNVIFVDIDGNEWVRKSAAAQFSNTFILVQLVGDTGGTDLWMDLVDNAPKYLRLRRDPDWSAPEYLGFTANDTWRGMIAQQRETAFLLAGLSSIPLPQSVIVPIYQSASSGRTWTTPIDGPFPADSVLTGDFVKVPRLKAGVDTPYMVDVQDFSTDPPSIETRRGGYELYRNYTPVFNADGSWTLILDGDFSFQKDYLFPTGGGVPCLGGLPRMPDGTCVEPTTGPQPSGGNPPGGNTPDGNPPGGPDTNPPSTLDNPPSLAPALPTTTSPGPLVPPSALVGGCRALPGAYVDLCGEARSRAAAFGGGLGLLQLTLHANPEQGLLRVPTWVWADGAGYIGGPMTGFYTVDLPWTHEWETCSTDEQTKERHCEHHHEEGTYHLSLTVGFRPGRYLWTFGDRTRLDTGSLGQAYPAESDVQHVYSDTSLGQPQNLYTVRLNIEWVGDWSVSGDATGQGGLGGRQTTYILPYAVREAQAVRCSSDHC